MIHKNKLFNKFYLIFGTFAVFMLFFIIFNFKKLNLKNLNLKNINFINNCEPLTNNNENNNENNKKIILIGDSILNNSNYVPIGNSVGDNLKLKLGVSNVIVNAKDGATIETCHHQLNNISNSENNFLFVSIGGNNILNKQVTDKDEINKLFEKYKKLLEKIKIKYSKTNIYLLNLYFPTNEKYLQYTDSIIEWNKNISSLSSKYNILKIDELLTDDIDFTNEIEPSIIGSQKIANKILSV